VVLLKPTLPDRGLRLPFLFRRLINGRVDSVMYALRSFLCFIALIFAPITLANTVIVNGSTYPYSVDRVVPISSGVKVDYTVGRRDLAGKDWYKKASVSVNKSGTINRLLSARKRIDPLNIATVAAVAAAGWAIDELTNQVTHPSSVPSDYQEGYYWCVGSYSQKRCASTPSGSLEVFFAQFDGWTLDSYYPLDIGSFYIDYLLNTTNPDGHSGSSTNRAKRVSCADGSSYCDAVPVSPGDPVSESDLWPVISDVLNSLPASQLRQLFENAGIPILTPELAAALENYANEFLDENGNPYISPEAEDEALADAEKETDEQPEDWWDPDYELDEAPEVPIQEVVDYQSDWSSGFGSGSCPGSVTAMGQQVSFDVLCDGAPILKWFVISIGTVLSALIIAGVKI